MTVMDNICGWEDEERLRSKFAACMWIYTKKKNVYEGARRHSRNGGVVEAAYDVHNAMHELGVSWNFHRPRVGTGKHNRPT